MSLFERLHPEARQELLEAFVWYEEQSPGLGESFVDMMELAFESGYPLPIPPDQPGGKDPRFRRILTKTFPYTIFLEIRDDTEPFVLAVSHQKRRPGYWLRRAPRGRRGRRRR